MRAAGCWVALCKTMYSEGSGQGIRCKYRMYLRHYVSTCMGMYVRSAECATFLHGRHLDCRKPRGGGSVEVVVGRPALAQGGSLATICWPRHAPGRRPGPRARARPGVFRVVSSVTWNERSGTDP